MDISNHKVGLSLIRLTFGFIVLKNIIFYFPTSSYYFGRFGIAPWDDFVSACNYVHLPFVPYLCINEYCLYFSVFVYLLTSFCFCLGIGGTTNGVVFYFFYFVFKIRNGLILDGSDNVIAVILPFLIFSDCYRFFNVENKFEALEFKVRNLVIFKALNNAMTLGIMLQVVFIYFFTAVAKSAGAMWQNGTAIYYTMRVEEFMATQWNIPLTQNIFFVVLGTYFTLLIEIAFPFLIWFKSTKFLIMGITALLHVGIFVFMRIDNFSWVMISTYPIFVSDSEFSKLKALASQQLDRVRSLTRH